MVDLKELDRIRIREWNAMDQHMKEWIIANWIEEYKRHKAGTLVGARWLQKLIRDGQLPKEAEAWAKAAIQLQLIKDLTK